MPSNRKIKRQYNQKNSTDDYLCKLRNKQGKKRIETNLRLSEKKKQHTHKHNGVLVMFLQIFNIITHKQKKNIQKKQFLQKQGRENSGQIKKKEKKSVNQINVENKTHLIDVISKV